VANRKRGTDDVGPPWKDGHDGIPIGWVGIGSGGNALVWESGECAIKRLRSDASKESIARFEREANIAAQLASEEGLSITAVWEIRRREGAIELVMERLDGSLDDVIGEFAGQPALAARTLVPIVDTLARLAARQNPLIHRDLKPSNLLYRRDESGKLRLLLSDFGCAYLAEDERLTPTHRAIGAWAFRPPEYSNGRVEDVSEKGDVFSLGKVLWSMVNGKRGVTFPGPVWFTPEYNLSRIFPGVPGISHAMLIVARACSIDPEARPSLTELATMLASLDTLDSKTPMADDDARVRQLEAEAKIAAEFAQQSARVAAFVRHFHEELHQSLARLHEDNPDSRLFDAWNNRARKTPQTADALVQQVAVGASDAPVVNERVWQFSFTSRFFPAKRRQTAKLNVRFEDETSGKGAFMEVLDDPSGTQFVYQLQDGSTDHGHYSTGMLMSFLERAAAIGAQLRTGS